MTPGADGGGGWPRAAVLLDLLESGAPPVLPVLPEPVLPGLPAVHMIARRRQVGTVNADVIPPSSGNAAPVMKPASSLARYATVPASSSAHARTSS
jgi:hypothetical protein